VVKPCGRSLRRVCSPAWRRGVAEVMAQGDGFGQVLVEAEGPGDRAAIWKPRGSASAWFVVVAEGREKNLRLVLEARNDFEWMIGHGRAGSRF